MAVPQSVADTVQQMKTQMSSLTFDWDVVVNYSAELINKLLAASYKDKPQTHIKDLKFTRNVYNDQTDKYYGIHYKFGLGAPVISFQPGGEDPLCTLIIPVLSGTVQVDGKGPTSVPGGVYSLKLLNLKLATTKGSWDSNPQTGSDRDMFVFHDDTTDGHVIIDLQTSKDLTVRTEKLDNAPASSILNVDEKLPDISLSIEKLFKDSKEDLYKSVRYEIARVKPSAPPTGTYQLQPTFFVFDIFTESENPSESDGGILSLFIHTRANPPKSNVLPTSWRNQWRVALKCSPIPKGETASIIISKELIYEKVLEPAIKAKGFTVERSDEDSSIRVMINTKYKIDVNPPDASNFFTGLQVNRIRADIPALTLKLTEHDSCGGSEISWKFACDYIWTDPIVLFNPFAALTRPPRGIFTITHEIYKRFCKAVLDDRHLVVDCAVIPTDWIISLHAEYHSASDWAVQEVALPDFQITLADINFFLTTNLLLPDNKQVIDVDKNSGLHIPGDFYLVGTVKEL